MLKLHSAKDVLVYGVDSPAFIGMQLVKQRPELMKSHFATVFQQLASSLTLSPFHFNSVAIAHRGTYEPLLEQPVAGCLDSSDDEVSVEGSVDSAKKQNPFNKKLSVEFNRRPAPAVQKLLVDHSKLHSLGEPIVLATLATYDYDNMPVKTKMVEGKEVVLKVSLQDVIKAVMMCLK